VLLGLSAPLGLVSLAWERTNTPKAQKEGIIQRFLSISLSVLLTIYAPVQTTIRSSLSIGSIIGVICASLGYACDWTLVSFLLAAAIMVFSLQGLAGMILDKDER